MNTERIPIDICIKYYLRIHRYLIAYRHAYRHGSGATVRSVARSTRSHTGPTSVFGRRVVRRDVSGLHGSDPAPEPKFFALDLAAHPLNPYRQRTVAYRQRTVGSEAPEPPGAESRAWPNIDTQPPYIAVRRRSCAVEVIYLRSVSHSKTHPRQDVFTLSPDCLSRKSKASSRA